MQNDISITKMIKLNESLLSQLIEGEKDEARAWDDDALKKHIEQEAKKILIKSEILKSE